MKIYNVIIQCDDDVRIEYAFDKEDIAHGSADKLRYSNDCKVYVEETELLKTE